MMNFKKAAEILRNSDGFLVVSHYDCDGLSSAAVLSETLRRLEKDFELKIVKRLPAELPESEVTVFADLGSGYLDWVSSLPGKKLVLDHHDVRGSGNVLHLNPKLSGSSMSASAVCYLVAREFGFRDLSVPALVGSLGDLEKPPRIILEDASDFGVRVRPALRLFGNRRPVHKTLEYSFSPFIPGITGNESAAVQFLSDLGIPVRTETGWRTLADLSEAEVIRLADGLARLGVEPLEFRPELNGSDLRETATVVNACGRLGEYDTGIRISLSGCPVRGEEIMKRYRKLIASCVSWVRRPENVERKTADYVFGKNFIPDTVIGTVVSMCVKSGILGPVAVGFAEDGDGVKVSARSLRGRISDAVYRACSELGGFGGGHEHSAGGFIPSGTEEKFVEIFENLIRFINVKR